MATQAAQNAKPAEKPKEGKPKEKAEGKSHKKGPSTGRFGKKRVRKHPSKHKKINRKHPEFELTYDMMLGIRTTVGQIESKPHKMKLSSADMNMERKLRFPGPGSNVTPAHQMRDFKFKDYAPEVFRQIRARFGIQPADYLLDICGNFQYLEFISNSKSGQFFFYSHDRRYMIKTITQKESKFLRQILEKYYQHIMKYPNTLLTRFYGMHRVKPHKKKEVHFLIMGSVFYTKRYIHITFDLKGSKQGRYATAKEKNSSSCVYKDNDFLEKKIKIQIGYARAKLLNEQIAADVEFLCKLEIMDYSLLLGINYLDRAEDDEQREKLERKFLSERTRDKSVKGGTMTDLLSASNPGTPMPGERSVRFADVKVEWKSGDKPGGGGDNAGTGSTSGTSSVGSTAGASGPGSNANSTAGPSVSSPGERDGRSESMGFQPVPASPRMATTGPGSQPPLLKALSAGGGAPKVGTPAVAANGAQSQDQPSAGASQPQQPAQQGNSVVGNGADGKAVANAGNANNAGQGSAGQNGVAANAQPQSNHVGASNPSAPGGPVDGKAQSQPQSQQQLNQLLLDTPPGTPSQPHGENGKDGSNPGLSKPPSLDQSGPGGDMPENDPPPWELIQSRNAERRQTRYGLPKRYNQFSTPGDINFEAPEFEDLPLPLPEKKAEIPESKIGSIQPVQSVFTREDGGTRGLNANGEWTNEVYYMGIIDILTLYNVKKRLESFGKSFRYEKQDISAVDPKLYAERFKRFMANAII